MGAAALTPARLDVAGATTPGDRLVNEDAWCAAPTLGLAVVADGLGGHRGGEVASALTVRTALEAWRLACARPDAPARSELSELLRDDETALLDDVSTRIPLRAPSARDDAEAWALEAVRCANDRIVGAARANRWLTNIGSTTAMLYVGRDQALIATLGNTRVYRLRGATLSQLSADHTLLEEFRTSRTPGEYTPTADDLRSWQSILVRALGMSPPPRVDVHLELTRPDDVFLIATDGIHSALSHARLEALVAARTSPSETARALVDAARDARAEDNGTACVVRLAE